MRENLVRIYLDWINNYVSIETFADHNGLTIEQANGLLVLAKAVFNSPHPDA